MRPPLAVLFVLTLAASPASAIVFDSFDAPLPPNRLLSSGRTILFVGPTCDGSQCPPDPIVLHDDTDFALQTGLPGIPAGYRQTALAVEGDEFDVDRLDMEIQGGAVHLVNDGPDPARGSWIYGDPDHKMGLDLMVDGADRFEIVMVSEAPTFTPFEMQFVAERLNPDGTRPDCILLGFQVTAPGVISIPFDAFTCDFQTASFHHVDRLTVGFLHFPPGNTIRIEEIRTNATPTPVSDKSWGRLKANYR